MSNDDTSFAQEDDTSFESSHSPAIPTPEEVAAEAEKWKQLARKHERDSQKTLKELEALRQQSMSDQEKAIAAARTEARAEALRESGTRLVDAEVRAAVKGRDIDARALLDGLDRTRFLDDDGQADVEKIAKWVDKIAPLKDDRTPPGRGGPRTSGDRPNDMNSLIRRSAFQG